MKKWLDAYFGFSRKEFNGLMVLIALILLVMLVPYVYRMFETSMPITEAEKQAVLKLALEAHGKPGIKEGSNPHFKEKYKHKTELFMFDPNAIGQPDWERLGLSPKHASAILRYVKNGGRFKNKEDLQKMYTISKAMYDKLSPYVRIASNLSVFSELRPKHFENHGYAKRASILVELNGADTTALDKIRGIGMAFANRIIKYRERIGGFYKKEQLMEVFGLDSLKYNEIKDQVEIDVSGIKKINVNTAGFEDFKNHPYIRYKQVNALIQYRKQHGNYSNIADLNKVAVFSQETIDRLAAYLEF